MSLSDKKYDDKKSMIGPLTLMLTCFGILFGAIFISKALYESIAIRNYKAAPHIVTVSAMKLVYSFWQPKIRASGSVRAIKGVNVTTELAGMVAKIYFIPGAFVNAGDILVQLNANTELAQLNAAEANLELAKITYLRDTQQFAVHAVSKQTVDNDRQNLKSLQAQANQAAATLEKKTIRAPFTGRLGISAVNPGQYLNAGDKVVTLQMFDPIYVDFYVPQQELVRLKVGQSVAVTLDTVPNQKFVGKITTIDPIVDVNTRNVAVEATVLNPKFEMTPGMFAAVEVDVGKPERYLTLPQTAISFNSYGDIIYIIHQSGTKNKPTLIAEQVFVETGETRGDQITILKGANEGDLVVTSGQLKLRNGTQVVINNSILASNNPEPSVMNEHTRT